MEPEVYLIYVLLLNQRRAGKVFEMARSLETRALYRWLTWLEPPHDQTCHQILANIDYHPPQFSLNLHRSQLIRTLDLEMPDSLVTPNIEIVLGPPRRTWSQSAWDFPSCSKFFLSSPLIVKTELKQKALRDRDWEGYDLLPDRGCDARKPARSCSSK